MSNRDLLKEAIADAKAVKEMAISNAKAALEEAFTPQLKSMLEKKLTEMDEEDDKEMEEAKMHDKEDSMEEAKHDKEADTMSEEELEELLAELEEGDEEEMHEEEEEPEADEEEKEEEEFDLEEMSEEDLKAFIEDVVDEMIEAGELEAGEEEMEAPEMEASEEEVTDEESEEEPMMEGKKEKMDELDLTSGGDFGALADMLGVSIDAAKYLTVAFGLSVPAILAAIKVGGDKAIEGFKKMIGKRAEMSEGEESLEELDLAGGGEWGALADMLGTSVEAAKYLTVGFGFSLPAILAAIKIGGDKAVEGFKKLIGKKAEMEESIETLKAELNEVNLLNSKLLYTNKIFKAKNLSEAQKVKVLTTFDKAESVKEVKLVYETLLEGLTTTASNTKEAIKESKSFASKAVGTSPKKPVVETDGMVSRFQRLAGIK